MSISNSVQNAPYKIQVEKDKTYSWCSCGYSANQPFCDGSHKEKSPGLKSIKYTAEEDKLIYFCGCKRSKSGVICDGSHN